MLKKLLRTYRYVFLIVGVVVSSCPATADWVMDVEYDEPLRAIHICAFAPDPADKFSLTYIKNGTITVLTDYTVRCQAEQPPRRVREASGVCCFGLQERWVSTFRLQDKFSLGGGFRFSRAAADYCCGCENTLQTACCFCCCRPEDAYPPSWAPHDGTEFLSFSVPEDLNSLSNVLVWDAFAASNHVVVRVRGVGVSLP